MGVDFLLKISSKSLSDGFDGKVKMKGTMDSFAWDIVRMAEASQNR